MKLSWMIGLLVVLAVCGLFLIQAGIINLSDFGISINTASQKPAEISVFITDPGQPPTADNKIYKMIQDKLGISLKFEFLVGDREQKLGVMIAGGDYPDVITGNTKLVNAGALIPLEDLIKTHTPRLYEHYKPYWNMVKEPKDGHIYILPNYGRYYGQYKPTTFYGPAFWIQKAVLAEFGYPKVKTLDQYFDLIVKYKQKYPTIDGQSTIGFTVLTEGWRDFCLKNPPQHLVGHPNDGGVVVDQKTFKAEVFADKECAKRYYRKLNQMNARGIVDKESFVMTYDQYIAKLSSGRVLGMFDQLWNYQTADASLRTRGLVERTYAPCPITFDEKTRDWYMDRTVLNLNNGFSITKKCKDPVRFLKLLDAMLTEEWQKILTWGNLGEDYEKDANGTFYRTSEQRVHGDDPMWRLANTADTFWYWSPKMEGTFEDGNACGVGNQPGEFFASLKPYEQNFLNKYAFKSWTEFFSPPPPNPIYYPAWQINLVDGSPAKIADTKMGEVCSKYLPKLIMARPGNYDQLWETFVREYRSSGVKDYENRINEQIKWRIKHWSNR